MFLVVSCFLGYSHKSWDADYTVGVINLCFLYLENSQEEYKVHIIKAVWTVM